VSARRGWALALVVLAGCATDPYKRAGNVDDVASALSRREAAPGRPVNAGGRPLAFLALAGAKGPRLAAYDLGDKRVLWTQPAELKARVEVGGDFVVHAAAGALVGRDQRSGAERWRRPTAKDERLLGYAADGALAFALVQQGGSRLHGGAAFVVALDGATGAERWKSALPSANAGGPAAGGGLVAVLLQSQYVTLLDARTGAPLAQVLSNEEAATFVRALPEGVSFGSRGVFRLSRETARATRQPPGYVAAKLPEFVRPVYWFDQYRPEQGDYSALDRNRILWRLSPDGPARLRDDVAVVHNFRFFFGFDATSGALRWAYNQPSTEAVSSAHVGDAVLFVTAAGELGALDTKTGRRTYTAQLPGEVVRGATFDADGFAPREPGATPTLTDALSSIVWDPDRRFWDVKMYAIEALAAQPGREVTGQLLKITETEGLPPAVYQKAGEALVARKADGASADSGDLLAHALERHADYAEGRPGPAVDVLARAAGSMKAKAASAALVAHLRRPETSAPAAAQIARALAALEATDALPALRDFVTMYRADPLYDGDPTALVAASEAMLALGGPAERQLLLYLAEEPRTVAPLRAHLRRALAQTAAAAQAAPAAPTAAE
jgi:outer membrane protein assembly factor BamB